MPAPGTDWQTGRHALHYQKNKIIKIKLNGNLQ